MNEPRDLMAWRRVTTGLLALLVGGTLLLVGSVGFDWLRRQNEETQTLIHSVRLELIQAERELEQADALVRRTLRLETKRLKFSILVELCTIFRLEGQSVTRCKQASDQAKQLVKVIREFRERLRAPPPTGTSTSDTGGTATVTQTRTMTAPLPNTVGESDHCPPNNPHC